MKPSVLIVDDSLTVRKDLEAAFGLAGFDTATCGSVAEARAALAAGAFSLVLLDVILPDGDGLTLLEELRRTPGTADLPIMMLSTEAEVADRIRGLTTGADE